LAGPAVARIAELLRNSTRGYREREEVLSNPRGRILWSNYVSNQLPRGSWHQLPCRFPDLTADLKLRRYAKWTLGRIRRDLVEVAGRDPLGMMIASIVTRLLDDLRDVHPLIPRVDELRRALASNQLLTEPIRHGVEAMAWIVEERGLGGGREMDGLAWRLSLNELWEHHVEAVVRAEAALVGAEVRSGRLGQTTFPLVWGASALRSMTKLVPDIVVRRGTAITIVDAKYKAHFAEIDESGWRALADDVHEAHRADVHQALAYAALFDANEITTRLVYPLRIATWRALVTRNR